MTAPNPSSRTILRAALRTLRHNPRLLWFPILTGIGAVIVFGVAALLSAIAGHIAANPEVELGMWSWLADPHPSASATVSRGYFASGALAGIAMQLLSLVSTVALSSATMEAMAGRPFSCRTSLRAACSRLGAIATVAVINFGIGRMLRGVGQGSGLAKSVLAGAWWAVTYLVVPVLAREPKSGFATLQRSASLFKQTWTKAFVGRLMLGWIWALATVVIVVPTALCLWWGSHSPVGFLFAVGVPSLLALVLVSVVRTLDTIYRTALYIFATEGVVPEPFDDPELHAVFCVSPKDA